MMSSKKLKLKINKKIYQYNLSELEILKVDTIAERKNNYTNKR